MDFTPRISPNRRRGRGATANATGRYELREVCGIDDGWGVDPEDGAAEAVLRTHVREERARTIIARNTSPDVGFDRSINPYRGCEHGCIYCFARPTHAYLGLSPGLDFETELIAKPNAAEQLEAELRRPSYRPQVIAIGTNTDAYQPVERDRRIMRRVLEVLQRFDHPVSITTKGTLVERDIDILAPMAEKGLAQVSMSVTTLDVGLSRKLEPRVPSPARRLAAVKRLSQAGVPVAVGVSPVIPALTDDGLEAVMQAARDAGAGAVSAIALRLPREVATIFEDWLREHVPDRADRVLNRVRELHGGKLYDPEFGTRMRGQGIWADLLEKRLTVARKRLGLGSRLPPLSTEQFAVPPRDGDQLTLF